MSEEDLLRETANKLGYVRLGNNVLYSLMSALQYAVEQDGITKGANGLYVLTSAGVSRAEATIKASLDQMAEEMEELKWFMDNVFPTYSLTVDDL